MGSGIIGSLNRRLVFALDVEGEAKARELIDHLRPLGLTYKAGLELILQGGAELLGRLFEPEDRLIADLKLGGDIDATMLRALDRLCSNRGYGVSFITVHDCVGRTVKALRTLCVDGQIGVLRVTVLTDEDPANFGGQDALTRRVVEIAKQAIDGGAAGVVCSPREIAAVRAEIGEDPIIMAPGLRPNWAAVKGDDQKRTMIVEDAFRLGASLGVVGRPIRDAVNPKYAAERIIAEIKSGLDQRLRASE